MPPLKKGGGSAVRKKQQLSSQVARHGIQHFFGRQCPSQAPAHQTAPAAMPGSLQGALILPASVCRSVEPFKVPIFQDELQPKAQDRKAERDGCSENLAERGTDAQSEVQHAQEAFTYVVCAEESPQADALSKHLLQESANRKRLSPGMMIMQSQDDGGDEVVWRVSPTVERLQAAAATDQPSTDAQEELKPLRPCSMGNKPAAMQEILSKASVFHLGAAPILMKKKKSPGMAGKLEQWLLSSTGNLPLNTSKVAHNLIKSVHRGSEKENIENAGVSPPTECQKNCSPGKVPRMISTVKLSGCSRRRSLNPQRSADSRKRKGTAKVTNCGQRRKALLDLLDRVENAISIPDQLSKKSPPLSGQKLKKARMLSAKTSRLSPDSQLQKRATDGIVSNEDHSSARGCHLKASHPIESFLPSGFGPAVSELSSIAEEHVPKLGSALTISPEFTKPRGHIRGPHRQCELVECTAIQKNLNLPFDSEIVEASKPNLAADMPQRVCLAEDLQLLKDDVLPEFVKPAQNLGSEVVETIHGFYQIEGVEGLTLATKTVDLSDHHSSLLETNHLFSGTGRQALDPKSQGTIHFLVLEVADAECQNSNGSSRQKILRLLNEQSGAERVLSLRDEWFYTAVRPGDTLNVIGQFGPDGTCVIDHDHNLLVVHPDLLISGSRVGGSFSCPRRAVLDERIQSSDTSMPALLGTMLHQLFQYPGYSRQRTTIKNIVPEPLFNNFQNLEAEPNRLALLGFDCWVAHTQQIDACVKGFLEEIWKPKLFVYIKVGLRAEAASEELLEKEARTIVQRHIDGLYSINGNEGEALQKLVDAIPSILDWLLHFRRPLPLADFGVKFNQRKGIKPLSISEVVDIEETIWSPKYGLKGMLDASVCVKLGGSTHMGEDQIMPLEFKTGKGTTGQAALEHRAQVILYTLLMSDRYMQDIGAGLLYYLHTNQTQGVVVQHADLAGLMMRRNEHATNLLSASSTQLLPPLLQSLHMCQSCRHLDTCTVYHKAQEGGTAETSGLGGLFDLQTGHLTRTHSDFLQHWDRLIDLEAHDIHSSRSEIWRMPSWQREEQGRCLSCLVLKSAGISDTQSSNGSSFVYCFFRPSSSIVQTRKIQCSREASTPATGSLLDRPFSCGDYVLLSTESGHIAVASGVITGMNSTFVSISVFHRLRLPKVAGMSEADRLLEEVWRIDKDERASSLALMRYNLLQLFVRSNGDQHRRRLIVDLEAPKFESGAMVSQDPAAIYVKSAPDLNNDQRRAIHKILAAKDYTLILGMPGTGKTSTIVHAVKALLARGASILLTSYTNSAVDNILLKLKMQDVDFIRVGRTEAIHPELRGHAISGPGVGVTSVGELEALVENARVVGVTCLGITHPLFAKRKFDVCIVDEAGQITLPVCLGPLRCAHTFVLVGDHYQLPPLVRNPEAREKGMTVSLFRRLSEAHPQAVSALQCQYRMCADIMALCNALIYGNRLRCGSPQVANAGLKLATSPLHAPPWLLQVLDPSRKVLFLDTDATPAKETRMRKAIHNALEASLVLEIVTALIAGGMGIHEVGVISPYNAQVDLIQRGAAEEGLNSVEVHTVDKYQGRDKECMLVSFVRSNRQRQHSGSLLGDWHRINVAITRAKKKLVMIGSRGTLSTTPLLGLLVKQVEGAGGLLQLPPNAANSLRNLKGCSGL